MYSLPFVAAIQGHPVFFITKLFRKTFGRVNFIFVRDTYFIKVYYTECSQKNVITLRSSSSNGILFFYISLELFLKFDLLYM